jgi:hypothetical protein
MRGAAEADRGAKRRLAVVKFLIGVATAALWFALSHAANAEQTCRQICDNGSCVSRCASAAGDLEIRR